MIIKSVELIRLNIPFRKVFSHSSSSRSHSDTILVKIQSNCGAEGWGEILARSYVTGETHDEIMTLTGPALAESLLGRRFDQAQELLTYVEQSLNDAEHGGALFGGFELALWNLCSNVDDLNLSDMLSSIVGAPNHSAKGHCLTVGFETELAQLRHCAIQAKLSKATVIKVKLGTDNDLERLRTLNDHLGAKLPIRLDANSCLRFDEARELLLACGDLPIQSIEQPFDASSDTLTDQLGELFACTGIPIVADESVCTMSDARRLQKSASYQVFNIRVGKCGGLIGTRLIRDFAEQHGIAVVAGTMVGETAILNQASKILLSRSKSFDYVEGLNQYQSFLSINPASPDTDSSTDFVSFSYNTELCDPLVVSTASID